MFTFYITSVFKATREPLQVEELYSVDSESLQALKQVFAGRLAATCDVQSRRRAEPGDFPANKASYTFVKQSLKG